MSYLGVTMKPGFIISLLLLASLFSFGVSAEVNAMKKRVLVSVGDLKENDNLAWKKSTCDQIYSIANQIADNGVDVVCRTFDTNNFKDSSLGEMFKKFDFHLRILRSKDDSVSIDTTKIHRIHNSDFKTLGWKFKDGEKTKITKEQAMAKALGNFFFYVSNETAFKAGLLVNGVHESSEIEYDQKNGLFKDSFTNEPISINKAYSVYEKESERKANYLRTGVELGVLLSSAMAIYYKNLSYNQVDFDYGFQEGIKKKFTGEAIRFDDNDKYANYGHEVAGVLYYGIARSNGLNSLESFLVTFASSTAWEFLEYHEVLSINDQILTPIGGYVIGEATYQIGCALIQKNSVIAKTLGYTLNPALATNHGIDKLKGEDKFANNSDCSKPRWSDISMYIGLDRGQKPYNSAADNNMVAGIDATVVTVDGYNQEGKSSKLVYDTAMAKALIETNGNKGLVDLKVVAQIMAAAYNQKDISIDNNGQLRGYDILLGVGSSSTWSDRGGNFENGNEDFYGTIGILGANATASLFYNGFHIKADMAFYGDFAMVKSYSIDKFKNSTPAGLSGLSSVLTKREHYWGMGTSTLAAISIQKGKWEVGYNGQISNAESIDGHHRYQENVTRHDQFKDLLSSHRVFISYQLTKNLKIKLSREYNFREGSVNGDFKTKGTETRTSGTLVYQF